MIYHSPMEVPSMADKYGWETPLEKSLAEQRDKLLALAQWCKPDEHSPPEHWVAYRACFPASGEVKS
jgi:hypothetical protein